MATVEINSSAIKGEFAARVVDYAGEPPSDVIRVSDPFRIKCRWHIQNGLASMLCGTWHVRAAFESVGPGPEFYSDEKTVVLDGRTGPGNPYTASLDFPAGPDFPGGVGPKVQPQGFGTYEVAVILSCTNDNGDPVAIAASVNLERLTIFRDK